MSDRPTVLTPFFLVFKRENSKPCAWLLNLYLNECGHVDVSVLQLRKINNVFLSKFLNFRIVLDLHKSCRDREFLCTPHPVSLIVSILYNYGTFVKIKKNPVLIHYYQLNSIPYSVFINFPLKSRMLHYIQPSWLSRLLPMSCDS